jgi:hypothetical protein
MRIGNGEKRGKGKRHRDVRYIFELHPTNFNL